MSLNFLIGAIAIVVIAMLLGMAVGAHEDKKEKIK